MQIISSLSLWWVIPIVILAAALAYYVYYKKHSEWNESLTVLQKYTLISLRGISLFLLLISLLGIVVQYQKKKVEKPILILAIDDSSSMLNYSDSNSVKKDIVAFQTKVNQELSDKYTIHSYSAASHPVVLKDNWKFELTKTNLFEGLDGIKKSYQGQNLASIVLLSDGNLNEGNLPQYAIQDLLQTAVYTIGVGDTLFRPDQSIKNILTNDRVLLGNSFIVNVDVQADGFPLTESKVELLHKGKIIASKQVNFGKERSSIQSLLFEVEPENIGVQAYSVKIEHKKGEHTFKNNSSTFYINVIDGRNKIILLADGPHPDLKAIHRALERDENCKVEFHLMSDWNKDLQDVTLLVVHSPGNISNPELASFIGNSLVSKLFIVGTSADDRFFKSFTKAISIPNSKQQDDVLGVVNVDFNKFQIDPSLDQALKNWTPLKVKYGSSNFPAAASIFLFQKVGPVVKKDPLIYFTEHHSAIGKSKVGVIAGEGIWRWRMSDFAQNHSTQMFDGMISKIAQYLSVKQNQERFVVQAPKQLTTQKDALFLATLFNASMDIITSEKINFELEQDGKKIRKSDFSVKDSNYYLNIGKLNSGVYQWQASVVVDGKKLVKKGELFVQKDHIEQMEIRANHDLLIQLANVGGGQFQTLSNSDLIIKELKSREDLTSKTYSTIELKELISFFWFFILIILSLSMEWFFRRFWGNY